MLIAVTVHKNKRKNMRGTDRTSFSGTIESPEILYRSVRFNYNDDPATCYDEVK